MTAVTQTVSCLETKTVLATLSVLHKQQSLALIFKHKTVLHGAISFKNLVLMTYSILPELALYSALWPLLFQAASYFPWPTSFLPVSGDPIVPPFSRRAEQNGGGVTYTAQWTYQWWGNTLRRTSMRNQKLFHYSEDMVAEEKRLSHCPHLKHNWVFLVLYCRGLRHPKSFTATTKTKLEKRWPKQHWVRWTSFATICILHLSSMA